MQVKIETSFGSLNVEMSEEDARKLMRYVCEHAERHETLETKRNNDLLKEINLTEKVDQFWFECMIEKEGAKEKGMDVHDAYVSWSIKNKIPHLQKVKFFSYLRETGRMQDTGYIEGQKKTSRNVVVNYERKGE